MKLAALDMAGTTVNEQGLVYKALRQAVEERDVTVSDADFLAAMGTRKDTAIAHLLTLGGVDVNKDIIRDAYHRFTTLLQEFYDATPPQAIDGVEGAFATLRDAGVKVALTTGFSAEVATGILERLGWTVGGSSAVVDAVITADTVAAGRPAPYMIHHAMEITGVDDVRDVAAAGDTIADLLAGTRSGASVVAGVLTGETPKDVLAQQPHTHLLASVADLPATLLP